MIGLAPNLFYGTGLAGAVLIMRRKKPADRKGKILFIDASELSRKGRAQNSLDRAHSDQIVAWYRAFKNTEGKTRVVAIDDIEKEGWTLGISNYLEPLMDQPTTLIGAIEVFKAALSEARVAEDHLHEVLKRDWFA